MGAEALGLCFRVNKRKRFLLSDKLHPQTISCVKTRAGPFGIAIEVVDIHKTDFSGKDIGGVIFQYPDTTGTIQDFTAVIDEAAKHGTLTICATDNFEAAWRVWSRHCPWYESEVWSSPRLRRSTCWFLRHQEQVREAHAW